MKITAIETLETDAGFRKACFVKVTTDEAITGWSEYGEHMGNAGLGHVIRTLAALVVGRDPLAIEETAAWLKARTLQAAGGLNQHAAAAIVNALFDIKGKALGVPVSALFGGALRKRIPFYWSHCGTYRAEHAALMGLDEVRTYDDLVRLGAEARERSIKAVKTGIMLHENGRFSSHVPGFAWSPGWPALNLDRDLLAAAHRQMAALREGLGADVDLMLDVNFNFRVEGHVRLARSLAPYDLAWLELDMRDAEALARIRQAGPSPIASLEALYGRQEMRPYLQAGAADVAIIDVAWNGYLEAFKMAALAEAHEVNVATHNFHGGVLSDVMAVHFAAAIPNLRIAEFDVDDIPWKSRFLKAPLLIEDGELVVPEGPGWGIDVDEDYVRAHPPR